METRKIVRNSTNLSRMLAGGGGGVQLSKNFFFAEKGKWELTNSAPFGFRLLFDKPGPRLRAEFKHVSVLISSTRATQHPRESCEQEFEPAAKNVTRCYCRTHFPGWPEISRCGSLLGCRSGVETFQCENRRFEFRVNLQCIPKVHHRRIKSFLNHIDFTERVIGNLLFHL